MLFIFYLNPLICSVHYYSRISSTSNPTYQFLLFACLPISIYPPLFFLAILHFYFNDTASPEIYTLSLHDALPIWAERFRHAADGDHVFAGALGRAEVELHDFPLFRQLDALLFLEHLHAALDLRGFRGVSAERSEEHTSELQSLAYLVCRLLLEKKK